MIHDHQIKGSLFIYLFLPTTLESKYPKIEKEKEKKLTSKLEPENHNKGISRQVGQSIKPRQPVGNKQKKE